MSINRVVISGNLTRDPEMRQTAGGTQIMQFGVAVNDRRRNPQTGEWEDTPNFIDCVVFGSRAEPLSRFLSKGTKVAIEGKLRYSAWETKDGQRRSKLEVVVDDIEFMNQRGGQDGGFQGQGSGYQQNSGYQQSGYQQNSGYQGSGYQQPSYQQPSYQQASAPSFSAPSYAAPAPTATAPVATPPSSDVYDEDIPF